MNTEILTTSNGVTLKHRGGWMLELWAANALGYKQGLSVRELPIPSADMRIPGRKKARNCYRVEDVRSYIEARISTPSAA